MPAKKKAAAKKTAARKRPAKRKAAAKKAPPAGSDVPEMDVERVRIADLKLDSRNARKGDVASVAESLREFGQHRAAVVRRADSTIVAGNHMVMAAMTLGWEHINVVWVDDDQETAIRRGLADNATGDQATWDKTLLTELLGEVGTDVPGFDAAFLDKLLDDGTSKPEEDVPAYPIVAQPGEHYSYVLIVGSDHPDNAWLQTAFALGKERSYKNSKVMPSRAVSVEKFRELLPELAAQAEAADNAAEEARREIERAREATDAG
ncbi:MAG: ParB N-terminal domain-containing protein [Actinomycetota bacterium]